MTDHVKDQLCARIAELEKEKLELNEQLDIAQRPAPDGEGLVEALEQCFTTMLDSDHRDIAILIEAARDALAAYRTGGDQ